MAEGQAPTINYYVENLHTQRVSIDGSYIRKINNAIQAGNEQNDDAPDGEHLEEDSTGRLASDSAIEPRSTTPQFRMEAVGMTRNSLPKQPVQVSPLQGFQDTDVTIPKQLAQVISSGGPDGEGWIKLSEKIYMNNKQGIRRGSYVYKGKQKLSAGWRDVAIKLIPYDERNENEVKLLTKLEDHPNVIRFYDSDVARSGLTPQIYIVMELCSQNLKDYIESNKTKTFDFEGAFEYAKQIVAGVAFIHENNVLHRDLKLENILLSPKKEYIRVTDFGLSKQIDDGLSVDPVSNPGLGTDGYRAPEMHDELPMASFYSDTFSVAIVLFALFSNGNHPFGKDKYKWRSNIIDNKSRDFSKILRFGHPYDHKREQLIDLLKRCLKHNPRDRGKPCEMLEHPFFSGSHKEDGPGFLSKFTSMFKSQTSIEANSNETHSISQGRSSVNANSDVTQRIKRLEDQLNESSLSKIGFANAVARLRELQNLRGSLTFEHVLQLAECELYLKRGKQRDSLAIVNSRCKDYTSQQLEQMATSHQDKGHAIRAMILYTMIEDEDLDDVTQSSDEVAIRICRRVVSLRKVLKPLLEARGRHRDIAIAYGLDPIVTLLQKLRSVRNATREVKVSSEAMCLAQIASINGEVGDTKTSLKVCQEGLELMTEKLGKRKVKYKCYSWILQNMGTAYYDSGQYILAKHCIELSIESTAQATDFDSPVEKKELVDMAKRNLARVLLQS